MNKIPVLFLIFNRPDLTKISFEKIREYKPNLLYIAADGPRKDHKNEKELCDQARNIIEKIDWKCELKTLFREKNLGCKLAVSSAISWFFEHEEQGIILEDDVLVEFSFFTLCEELLEKYKNEEKISMISADNFSFGKCKTQGSYHFSYYSHVWGWATWRRAWKDYDVDLKNFLTKKDFFKILNFSIIEKQFWYGVFEKVRNGEIDTWDYQWVYTNFVNNRMSIIPTENLAKNTGFSVNATHTKNENDPLARMESKSLNFPLIHPQEILVSEESMDYSRNIFLPPNDQSIFRKGVSFIKKKLLNI